MQNEKVLITGAGGFIGANITRRLLDLGYEIHALVHNRNNLWRLADITGKLNIYDTQLDNISGLTDLFTSVNPDIIIHTASYGNSSKHTDSAKITQVIVNGTFNLLTASQNINYKLFINTGSSSEYGIEDTPMLESDPVNPITVYAAAKAGATHICQSFYHTYNKPIVTIRPFSVYGPYEEPGRFIPEIILRLIKGQEILLTPNVIRHDFIYIDDLVDIYLKIMGSPEASAGRIFNAGSGVEFTNSEVVQKLFSVTGKKVGVTQGSYQPRPWDTPHWCAGMNLTEKILKWSPEVTLETGLAKSYSWFAQNRHYYDQTAQ